MRVLTEVHICEKRSFHAIRLGTKNTWNIRTLVFHCVQYFCRGIVDQFHYILCLLEPEAPDDHQIAVEMIFGDEHIHIATLPTSIEYHPDLDFLATAVDVESDAELEVDEGTAAEIVPKVVVVPDGNRKAGLYILG